MSKIRINASIDVTKLDKSRFFKGDKGTYCNITMLVDLNELDQYGNSGFITEAKKKDEPKDLRLPILGNTKIVWREEEQQQAATIAAPSAKLNYSRSSNKRLITLMMIFPSSGQSIYQQQRHA